MSYEIKWTPLAKHDYLKTVSYIYDNWGAASAEKFTDDLDSSLKNLARFPFIGKQNFKIPSVRQFVVSRQQNLYYTIFENQVLVLNLIDTRMQD